MCISELQPFKSTSARAALALAIALALGLRDPAQATQSSPRSPANTIVVTNCNDGGAGSLRVAASSAVDGSVIDMTHLTCSTITLTSGEIVIAAGNVTINGPGADRLSVRVPTGHQGRNFDFKDVDSSYPSRLYDMTIEGGNIQDAGGGCIYSAQHLLLNSANVRDCKIVSTFSNGFYWMRGGAILCKEGLTLVRSKVTSSGISTAIENTDTRQLGGGVYARYGLNMDQSTISGNSLYSPGDTVGGGAASYGTTTILRSTISGNSANYRGPGFGKGGGLFAHPYNAYSALHGILRVAESTFSGNYAASGAAALESRLPSNNFYNSTIAGNYGPSVSGSPAVLFAPSATAPGPIAATLSSTIIAQNLEVQSKYELTDLAIAADTTISGSHNLIMNSSASPPDTLTAHPGLGALADNGGPTATMALPPGSPAIHRGDNANHDTWDQRGPEFPRVVGGAADIGAFESPGDRIFRDGFDPPDSRSAH